MSGTGIKSTGIRKTSPRQSPAINHLHKMGFQLFQLDHAPERSFVLSGSGSGYWTFPGYFLFSCHREITRQPGNNKSGIAPHLLLWGHQILYLHPRLCYFLYNFDKGV
jgi:hypothetical protein